jgi:hypothetical protein
MSNPVYVSVSQIQTFTSCKRKWAGQKLFGMEERKKDATTFGSEVHKILEDYAADPLSGFDDSTHQGRLAKAMWAHVPALYDAEVGIEQRIDLDVIDGVKLIGYSDLFLVYPDRRTGVVLDYKTTKSKRYIKGKRALENGDLQAAVYTKYGMVTHPDYAWACHWITGLTDGTEKVTSATAKLTTETVDRVWNDVKRHSADIVTLRRSQPKSFHNVEPTFGEACKAFGGCPFLEQCAQARELEVREEMLDTNALMARIAASKKTVAATSEPAATPEPTTPEPTTADVEGPTPEPTVDPINPPETASVVEKAELDPEPVVEKPKAKRGRKPKAKADPAPVADPTPIAAEPVAKTPTERTLMLFVDCYPMRLAPEIEVFLLSDIAQAAAETVAEKASVPHWSLAEFGSGKGGLVAELSTRLPRHCAILVNSYTDEAKALLPLLENNAHTVVKG